ncbi:hypothetical protein TREES_T100002803 [Tupaia chinensis]|uniref:Uncharacterized protein n=1 Tax=Tupaia chinensis TaxID=246437 RepID=L9KWZ4_TUPCH|nr:hypothetical protein TREES_T100002803 [Tupaia chinensis]
MSHFTNWKGTQMGRSSMPFDNIRVPHERKKENKKPEDLLGDKHDQYSPHDLMLLKEESAQNTEYKTREKGEDKAAEEDTSLGKAELRKDAKGKGNPSTKTLGRSWELPPPITKSIQIHDVIVYLVTICCLAPLQVHMTRLPKQGPFQQFMDMKVEKRLADWKERRSRFGDINMHKCYQFGQVFSPFQALATTEMRRLVFPRDLPISPHVQRLGTLCPTDVNPQDLSLSSTELVFRKDDNHREKEKPPRHMKTPLFPPIVRATKSNDMK